MKVLIDNDLSPHIAAAINALVEPQGHLVIALRKKFPPNTEDMAWIRALGEDSGWVVISGDTTITRRAAERQAWRQAKLIGFFVMPGWRKLNPLIQTARLLMWWDIWSLRPSLSKAVQSFSFPSSPAPGSGSCRTERPYHRPLRRFQAYSRSAKRS